MDRYRFLCARVGPGNMALSRCKEAGTWQIRLVLGHMGINHDAASAAALLDFYYPQATLGITCIT